VPTVRSDRVHLKNFDGWPVTQRHSNLGKGAQPIWGGFSPGKIRLVWGRDTFQCDGFSRKGVSLGNMGYGTSVGTRPENQGLQHEIEKRRMLRR